MQPDQNNNGIFLKLVERQKDLNSSYEKLTSNYHIDRTLNHSNYKTTKKNTDRRILTLTSYNYY